MLWVLAYEQKILIKSTKEINSISSTKILNEGEQSVEMPFLQIDMNDL